MGVVDGDNRLKSSRVAWPGPGWQTLALVAIALWAVFVVRTLPRSAPDLIDFTQYWDAAAAVSHHESPYAASARQHSPAPYVMPPLFAMLMIPFAMLPLHVASLLWYVSTLAVLFASCAITASLVRRSYPASVSPQAAVLGCVILAFFHYPVWTNAKLGQVTALLFFLIVGALALLGKGRPIAGGMALGLAIALKLLPLPLAAFALWSGKRRFGGSALATASILQLASALYDHDVFFEYWLGFTSIVGPASHGVNLSLVGMASRFAGTGSVWWFIAVLGSAGALVLPFLLGKREMEWREQLRLLALLLAAMAIASPVVESHYLLWLLLPLWMLLWSLSRRRSRVGLASLLVTFVLLSQPYRLARFIGTLYPLPFAEQVQGEIALTLGASLLFLLAAADALQKSRQVGREHGAGQLPLVPRLRGEAS